MRRHAQLPTMTQSNGSALLNVRGIIDGCSTGKLVMSEATYQLPPSTKVCPALTHRTHNGQGIKLGVISARDPLCKEFVVTSSQFCVARWLMLTAIFNIVGFTLKLHLQDIRVLSIVLTIVLLIFLLKLHLKVKQESLLVMASLGVQLTTTFASGRTKAKFYEMDQIDDIIINEAVTMHKVIFYLALLLNNKSLWCTAENKAQPTTVVRPLFTHSWPSLECLRRIHKDARSVFRIASHSMGPVPVRHIKDPAPVS